MAGLPEVTVAGTLTADPELRFTQSGVPVANFTVAANDRRFDKQTGQWVDGDATFLRCTLWRQPAENLAESLNKGARVLVTGTLRQRSYETGEGDKRTVLELDVTEVGASLKWATAKIAKAARTTGTTTPAADAWNATPAPVAPGGFADEPPF